MVHDNEFNGIIHLIHRGRTFASAKHKIFVSDDDGEHWSFLFQFSLSLRDRVKSISKKSRRLFRKGIHHIRMAGDRHLVIIGFGRIYVYDFEKECLLPAVTSVVGSRPLSLSCNGEHLYYGEYRNNRNRDPVHVFGSANAGLHWEPVYQFTEARHIHGIFWDRYSKAFWVTTGDDDSECGIWMTQNGFKTLDRVLGGSQQQRVVQLLFTKEYVYFGTDTPQERNYLYRMSRRDGSLNRLAEVSGSVFYGCAVGNRLFFSTVCEPSRVNRERNIVVWGSDDSGEVWKPFLTYRKDWWPMRLFQYGQVRFPAGDNAGPYLWLTPMGTNCDQRAFRFKVL